jgi:DNA polymerase III subunit delta
MQVKPEQLLASLQKSLKPVYLLSSEEPLQLGEAADAIRNTAKLHDYGNREIIAIENGDEWYKLRDAMQSISIFSEKKLLDLRLPVAKPGAEGSKTLINYCKQIPQDMLLLITTGKLEKSTSNSEWFKALDKVGVVMKAWPLQGAELLQWLQRRADRRGLIIDQDALKSLAIRIEGNLLAAAQELEKLYIQFGNTPISKALIEENVVDSSRHSVFELVDALLSGKLNYGVKVLNNLKSEGVAAPVVLWALSREIRILYALSVGKKDGQNLNSIFNEYKVWEKHQPLMLQALSRLQTENLQCILQSGAKCDWRIKGQLPGDPWEDLFAICIQLARPANTRADLRA